MFCLNFIVILTLFTSSTYADDFDFLNPPMTDKIKKSQARAVTCTHPALAEDKLDESFRYGCFCGKNYPHIKNASEDIYKRLDLKQRRELITQYYKIKPYDSIDEACMLHDICYIYQGGESQDCNDALYKKLRKIEDSFGSPRERDSKERRCKTLASDMASVFKTIFTIGDDASVIKFGMLAFTTPITMVSQGIQKSSQSFAGGSNYPLMHEKCITQNKKTTH